MLQLLVSAILAVCPGYEKNHKNQIITTECQEQINNCVVGPGGEITDKRIQYCVERYRHEKQQREFSSGTSSRF